MPVADTLVRRYGDVIAVDGVSFHFDAGETYGLLGGVAVAVIALCALPRLAMAAALLALGTWALRRSMTRAL